MIEQTYTPKAGDPDWKVEQRDTFQGIVIAGGLGIVWFEQSPGGNVRQALQDICDAHNGHIATERNNR